MGYFTSFITGSGAHLQHFAGYWHPRCFFLGAMKRATCSSMPWMSVDHDLNKRFNETVDETSRRKVGRNESEKFRDFNCWWFRNPAFLVFGDTSPMKPTWNPLMTLVLIGFHLVLRVWNIDVSNTFFFRWVARPKGRERCESYLDVPGS